MEERGMALCLGCTQHDVAEEVVEAIRLALPVLRCKAWAMGFGCAPVASDMGTAKDHDRMRGTGWTVLARLRVSVPEMRAQAKGPDRMRDIGRMGRVIRLWNAVGSGSKALETLRGIDPDSAWEALETGPGMARKIVWRLSGMLRGIGHNCR
jgi:hypothetical protein